MKKTLLLLILLIFAGLLVAKDKNQAPDNRFAKWLTTSYFRGYNVLYEFPKTQQDFIPSEMFYFLTVPGEGNRCKYQGGKSQAQGGNYKRGRAFTLSESDENTCCRN